MAGVASLDKEFDVTGHIRSEISVLNVLSCLSNARVSRVFMCFDESRLYKTGRD